MQRTLECSVCSDFYVPGTRPPKTLTCGHSFCAPCLHILYKGSTLNCPKCRKKCSLPDNKIDSLPTNYTTLEMLDSVCGECHNQPHNVEAGGESGSFIGPRGVACDGEQIYIADYCNHRVCVTDVQGDVVQMFGSYGSGEDEFRYPRGLALDTTGHLYVCDEGNHRIKVTTQQGLFVREFGAQVFEDKEPYHIAVSPDNKVAVTDESGNLYLFTTSGQHIRTIPGQTPPHNINATGVVFDGHGNILMTDYDGGRVVVMSETGEVRCFIGTEGEGRGELKIPEGLTITHNNDIVVCDSGNNRLQLFSTK